MKMPDVYEVEVPEEWKHLIRKLRTEFPAVVLAGGAPRDLLLGRKVKDLDFFISKSVFAGPEGHFERMGFEMADWSPVKDEYGSGGNGGPRRIDSVYHFGWVGIDCELIVLDQPRWFTPHTLIALHDIGLCQVAYDYGAEIEWLMTPAFRRDVADEALTAMTDWTPTATKKRLERISRKYTGWRIDDSALKMREPRDLGEGMFA